ncbi:UNVERIFIED_CONTAM: Required for meiotic nuclear division protein 1-like protein [Trichonephila clavipes]
MLGGKAKTFFTISWNIFQHSNIASCRRMSNVPLCLGDTLNSHQVASLLGRLVEGEKRWKARDHPQGVLPQNRDGIEPNHTVMCMVLKTMANDRHTLCHDEFCWPLSNVTVDQVVFWKFEYLVPFTVYKSSYETTPFLSHNDSVLGNRCNIFWGDLALMYYRKGIVTHISFKWNSGNNSNFLLPIKSLASKSLNIRKLSSGNVFCTTDVGGVQKSIAALQAKKRVPRKKVLVRKDALDQEVGEVIAYSSAEEYDLQGLSEALDNQGLYQSLQLPSDAEEVIHVIAKYKVDEEPREIYFFSEGSVVFWNVPDLEQQNVLRFLKPYETNSYDPELVNAEKEDMDYIHSDKGPKFSKGRIILNSEGSNDFYTYTFSNGLALSVKLAMWEAALENYIDSMEWVTENMKKGEKISMTRDQVFKKRGELFALRHVINLSSDLLDTPDFYWDRQDLEHLYQQICNHLNIAKRTKVMNERLSYCSELIDLLGNHMNDKHHVRLEWMIIILIMVEICAERKNGFPE